MARNYKEVKSLGDNGKWVWLFLRRWIILMQLFQIHGSVRADSVRRPAELCSAVGDRSYFHSNSHRPPSLLCNHCTVILSIIVLTILSLCSSTPNTWPTSPSIYMPGLTCSVREGPSRGIVTRSLCKSSARSSESPSCEMRSIWWDSGRRWLSFTRWVANWNADLKIDSSQPFYRKCPNKGLLYFLPSFLENRKGKRKRE